MAVVDQPSGLMDIASSLTQDEIPFKLRCAICNKLAVNAFRLPCCDQATCENCQISLPETCPVCAHTPISPDLCKPNKALRTTLKAFLRTEEKKREKERQAAVPAPTHNVPAVDPVSQAPPQETQPASLPVSNVAEINAPDGISAPNSSDIQSGEPAEIISPALDRPPVFNGDEEKTGVPTQVIPPGLYKGLDQEPGSGAGFPNQMGYNMNPAMFPGMGWNPNSGDFNPMAQFMGNGMMNFPNPMGMGMDPMAANQGMLGGYGMNMSGMSNGMSMGMNFNAGQGMYGGWDGSQNNMWHGQDKFNPSAFANGMGAQYGGPSGYGGYNMSQPSGVHPQMQQQQFPTQEFQNGYYGPGFGRGNFRGRGRGFVPGGRGGRGGFGGHMQASYSYNTTNHQGLQNNNSPNLNQEIPSQLPEGTSSGEAATSAEAKHRDEGTTLVDATGSSKDPELTEPLNNNTESGSGEPRPASDVPPDQAAKEEEEEEKKEEEQQLHVPEFGAFLYAPNQGVRRLPDSTTGNDPRRPTPRITI
ncbi:hypothetical protein AOCH_002871 [Aspergillus ochraceoroseus]|uniref:RING-type domain-containing protein n=1 Tax=Aspergillus ochraceoroseus TaxID=138278 RepID=A0A0F8WT80_9EURO|nr:hypothetical protein AOCH_002871 [Aspergillus ochraceoroseus]